MSSPPIAFDDAAPRRSTASSSTLASNDARDTAPTDVGHSRSTRAIPGTPDRGHHHNGHATNGHSSESQTAKRGSLGRSGGFLLASSAKFGSLGQKSSKKTTTLHHSREHSGREHDVGVTWTTHGMDGVSDNPHDRNGASTSQIQGGSTVDAAGDDLRTVSRRDAAIDNMPGDMRASHDGVGTIVETSHQPVAAIDPAQIVSMALNLSEGRRRHLASNSLSSPQGRPSTRIMSLTSPTPQLGPHYGAGGSLKKHLQDQRRISRHLTTKAEAKADEHHKTAQMPGAETTETDPGFHFRLSAATMSRTEKARKYFELSAQYRRLLSNLPAISPDSTGTQPGSDRSMQNAPPYTTSRSYNPLQVIRNRRTRARSRRPLDPPVELWHDAPAIDDWINVVENIVHNSHYPHGMHALLPRYPLKQHEYLKSTSIDRGKDVNNESRKLARPNLDWAFTPAELLADAYWLEQNDNRNLIEDRHGARLYFTARDMTPPRISVDGRPYVTETGAFMTGKDFEAGTDLESDRRRQHDSHTDSKDEHEGRLKHAWHKARRRSFSDSSELSQSESEKQKRPTKYAKHQSSDLLSTGPLELYLSNLAEQRNSQIELDRSKETSRQATDRDDSEDRLVGVRTRTFTDPVTSNKNKQIKRAQDDMNVWSPSSPMATEFEANSHEAPDNKATQDSPLHRRSAKHYLPFGRSQARHSKHFESGSTNAEDSDRSSRRQSEDSKPVRPKAPVHHAHSRGPSLVINTRTNESTSSLVGSPIANMNGRLKEPNSAVRRFLKGSMIGLRRDGHKHGKHQSDNVEQDLVSTDDTDTDFIQESDTEDISGRGGKLAFEKSRLDGLSATTDQKKGTGTKTKGSYHLDLPVFRPATSSTTSRPSTPDQETQAKRYARSPLRDASSTDMYDDDATETSTGLDNIITNSSVSTDQRTGRLTQDQSSPVQSPRSKSQDASQRLNSVIRGANMTRVHSSSLLSPEQKKKGSANVSPLRYQPRNRQWSITEAHARRPSSCNATKSSYRISESDIARIRALLICTGIKAIALARHREGSAQANDLNNQKILQHDVTTLRDREAIQSAASMLSSSIASDSSALHNSAIAFRNTTVNPLHRSLHELRMVVTECAEHARTVGDEAVGFGALITGQKMIEVRRVMDQMEKFRRRRRRRVRWIRRVAFGLLEWGVLLIMWQVWLVVVIFKTIWSVVRGVVGVGRWALWL